LFLKEVNSSVKSWRWLCLLVVYKTIVQFYTYESLKQLMLLLQNSSARPSTLQTVCYSLFACALYKLSTCCGVTFLLLFFVCGSGFLVARSWHFHFVLQLVYTGYSYIKSNQCS
jgi:hypothetical protein